MSTSPHALPVHLLSCLQLSFHSFNAGYFTNTSSPCSSDEDDVTDIATTSSSVSDVSEASDSDVSSDDDVAMYQQSASFMLKFSEFIYKHALRVSVQRSIHGNPGVKRAALNIAVRSVACFVASCMFMSSARFTLFLIPTICLACFVKRFLRVRRGILWQL